MKNNNQLGIYIHIPFCVQKCVYCDFLSAPATNDVKIKYIEALKKEIELVGLNNKEKEIEVNSIFFGGGTPSCIDPELIQSVLDTIKNNFRVNEFAEITIECNPGTLSEDKAYSYRNAGINRISFGLQSCDDKELKMLGRIHDFDDFRDSFRMARNYGFNNINVDLMTGLPGQTKESLLKTLKTALAFKPEHISAYGLILEEGTVLFDRINEYPPIPSEELDRQMYDITRKSFIKSGYVQYEISNYAKPGYECIHNLKYWNREEYLGFGIGAASFIDEKRYSNITDINSYIDITSKLMDELMDNKLINIDLSSLYASFEKLDINDAKEEFMFLGLRKIQGISILDYKEKFNQEIYEQYSKEIEDNINKGLLILENNRLKLTAKGIDISNTVMSDFII
ncbi:radical SAM family heme chaperone HemW [Lachnospira multipara]|uniref:radical SAM family heme chaperone HemW n=1 Tax=Lachnospira multipara TaxID=28051 RepID=UPI00048476EF|nr:radical SAM family heme chaperone HemW [Lachnospira multipara]